jgi:hypothetical protein
MKNKTFNVNQRFDFTEKLAIMVAKGSTPSLVVTGEGGLGKTHSVLEAVNSVLEQEDYVVQKGYSTPKGLYNFLYDNNGKLIIFDDCDSVLEKPVSLNILKGALDSYDKRIISWESAARGDEYPNKFEFTGKVIFISNKKRDSIDQAVCSRSFVVDLSMSPSEKIERMSTVLHKICPEIAYEKKKDALDLLDKHKETIKDLNFRTLIKVSKIRNTFDSDWENLATYAMMEG